jgi:hypothetical protein
MNTSEQYVDTVEGQRVPAVAKLVEPTKIKTAIELFVRAKMVEAGTMRCKAPIDMEALKALTEVVHSTATLASSFKTLAGTAYWKELIKDPMHSPGSAMLSVVFEIDQFLSSIAPAAPPASYKGPPRKARARIGDLSALSESETLLAKLVELLGVMIPEPVELSDKDDLECQLGVSIAELRRLSGLSPIGSHGIEEVLGEEEPGRKWTSLSEQDIAAVNAPVPRHPPADAHGETRAEWQAHKEKIIETFEKEGAPGLLTPDGEPKVDESKD